MSEKLAEVYEQYDMEILATRKGRGATILTTTEGLRILEPFRGSVTRLEQEYVLKQLFEEAGCRNLDCLIPNRDGRLFTCDKYRQPFVLKRHFEGNECDMHNPSEILRAVKALAQFHIYGKQLVYQFQAAWQNSLREKERKKVEEIKAAIANGEELEKISYVYEISQQALEEVLKTAGLAEREAEASGNRENERRKREGTGQKAEGGEGQKRDSASECNSDSDIKSMFIRHNTELKKIQRFVLRVKRKNAFENLFLQVFWSYYNQGLECVEMLSQVLMEKDDNGGRNCAKSNKGISDDGAGEILVPEIFCEHYGICHGSYNHHNVLLGENSEAIVHFERFSRGNQLNDLYRFARKVMEKNHFEFELLRAVLKAYSECIALSSGDYRYMYILFSYPEKFWKIANSYYNTNKAFLSPKYIEKLETVILQEEEKQRLLEQYKKEYIE